MVSGAIRGYIDSLDEFLDDDTEDVERQDASGTKIDKPKETWDFAQIHLGSRQRATTIASFVNDNDPAFDNFSKKLAQCIHNILMQEYLDSCEQEGTFAGSVIPPFPTVKGTDTVSTMIV